MSEFIAVVGDSNHGSLSDKGNHTIKVEKLVHAIEFSTGIIEASLEQGSTLNDLTVKIIDTETLKVVVQSHMYFDGLNLEASTATEELYADIPHRVMHRGTVSFGIWYKEK